MIFFKVEMHFDNLIFENIIKTANAIFNKSTTNFYNNP